MLNDVSVSGLSINDCPSGFQKYMLAIKQLFPIKELTLENFNTRKEYSEMGGVPWLYPNED